MIVLCRYQQLYNSSLTRYYYIIDLSDKSEAIHLKSNIYCIRV